MGIKNMPDFDDIDISDNSGATSNKRPKSGIDIKQYFAALGITTKEQLRPILQAFGYDKETIDGMLESFSTFDELQEALDSLDDLQDLMSSGPMMPGMMPQQQPAPAPQPTPVTPSVSRSAPAQPRTKDIFSEDKWEQDDIDELESIIDNFLSSSTTSEECVNDLCELLGDLDYCFDDDLQHVEDALDNMRNSGTTTREIKQYISSNVTNLQDNQSTGGQIYASDDDEEDEDNDYSDDDVFGESSEEEKDPKQIKIFNDILKEAMEREDKLFSISYIPFSGREFKTHFEIDDDDLEDNKIPISRFSEVLPEKWSEDFEYVTLATAFIEDENQFILCYLVPNFGNTSTIPASFLIYKDSSGFHTYVIKSENVVNEDGSLLTLEDVFTEDAINLAKKELKEALEAQDATAQAQQMMMGASGVLSSFPMGGQQPQPTEVTDNKLNKTLYRTLLQAIGGYNEKRMFDRCTKLMIKENSNPLMTLHMLGTLTPSLETKQYKDGYVYIGEVTLNDSEDVKYFLSDFELKPVNGKLEFYVKMEKAEIRKNDLPKYKDYIRDHFDFNGDALQNRLEVQVLDNIVFIEF